MSKYKKNSILVKVFWWAMGFATWLQSIPEKVTPAPFRLIQIGSSFWQSRALYVATKLKLADELADAEKSTQQLADSLQLNEDHLYRLMRMLSSFGIFKETNIRHFKNNAISQYLREDNPKNVRSMILMHNSPEMALPWINELEASIKDGEIPFEKANGLDLFEYMNQNSDFDYLFSAAMTSVESISGTDFLQDFNWGQFERLIDVGGSNGAKAASILQANPKLSALVFDRPQVIEEAQRNWEQNSEATLQNRMSFQGGDMLESIPECLSDKDVYLFMGIFHGFSDADCEAILNNLKTALAGRKPCIVIADAVADEMNIDPITASLDMQMLMGTRGRERTRSEWERLFDRSRFKLETILDIRTFAKYLVISAD